MPQKATLYVDNLAFNILHCEYCVSKPTDYIGNSTGESPNYSITARIETTAAHNLMEWAQSSSLVKNGHILTILNGKLNNYRMLYFIDAHCMSYEILSPQEKGRPAEIELTLIPQEMNIHIPENYSDFWTPEDEKQRMN